MNDFQRLPARLLPFFPHNFLPQQQAVNILASRINCLSHPRKTVNRHATSPIFAANLTLADSSKFQYGCPAQVDWDDWRRKTTRERERELWERGNKNWTRLRELGLGQITEHILPFFFCSRNILQGMKQHCCISAKILKNL